MYETHHPTPSTSNRNLQKLTAGSPTSTQHNAPIFPRQHPEKVSLLSLLLCYLLIGQLDPGKTKLPTQTFRPPKMIFALEPRRISFEQLPGLSILQQRIVSQQSKWSTTTPASLF
jgi:hypothetical protein